MLQRASAARPVIEQLWLFPEFQARTRAGHRRHLAYVVGASAVVIALGAPYVAHRADDGRAAPSVAPADEASPEQRRAGARAVSMTSSRKPFADTRARRGPHHSVASHSEATAARADDNLALHIRSAAVRHGVPERLVTALIAVESQFNPLPAPPPPPPRSGLAAFARKLRETVRGEVASTPERRDSAVQAP